MATEGPSALFSGALAASAATVVGHYPWFLTYNALSASLPTAADVTAFSDALAASSSLAVVATTSATSAASAIAATAAGSASLAATPGPFAILPLLASLHLDPALLTLVRSAFIGLCASSVSDVASNSLRVLKTTRQTEGAVVAAAEGGDSQRADNADAEGDGSSVDGKSTGAAVQQKSYLQSAREIIAADGWGGFLGRGLQTRLLANALQGTLFSVLFKYFQSRQG